MAHLSRRLSIGLGILVVSAAFATKDSDSSAQGNCGGEGQPGCGLDCQKNLVLTPLIGGRCRHPPCGRDGEAACTQTQRALKSCDEATPALVELAGRCVVRGVCGDEGQRACLAIERIPSCNNKNLAEVGGRCVHPPCGRAGQRTCNVTERGLQACDEGLAAISNVCQASCGAEGQRACLVTERIPPCNTNLANQGGTCRHPDCGRIGQRACPVPERLGQPCDTGLSEAPGCLGDCRGSIGTCFDRNLAMTEPTVNMSTSVPTPPAPDTNPLRGFADLHVHMFANLGFGGAVQVGAPYDPVGGVAKALAPDFGTDMDLVGVGNTSMARVMPCPPLVPNCGRNVLHANHIPVSDDFIGANGDAAKSYFGAPIFTGWPTWRTQTHQQVYYKWLERAWRSGMRAMVMLAVTNEFACGISKRIRGTNCQDSMAAMDKQLDAALAFESWHRTQPGGGWFRIVRTPDEAEQVIREGKLAVVLGIESDVLFGCKKKSSCAPEFVNGEVDKYFAKGVRYIYPVHDFDTQFAGTALFISELETGNRFIMGGDGFTTAPCPGISDTLKCNTRGLTPAGTSLIQKLMDKGMMIDIDHMSAKGIDETLALAEQRQYPLFVGHGLFNEVYTSGGNRHERMRTAPQLARLKALGGVVTVMTQDELKPTQTSCQQSSVSFLQNYRYAVSKMDVVAFGSDFTGSATHIGPRFGDDACNGNASQRNAQQNRLPYPVRIPGFGVFDKQVTGQRTFDFNTDGLAHIGLYPDLLGEMTNQGASIEPLMKSAGQLVSAWRKAAAPRLVTPSRPLRALDAPITPFTPSKIGPIVPGRADSADLSATWRINGNGYPGDVNLRQSGDGTLSGTLYGDPLSGFYAPGERTVVLLRGPVDRPIQAFVGQVAPDNASMSGRFYALNTTSAGGAAERNVFAFVAQRNAAAPPSAPAVPSSPAGPSSVSGTQTLTANGYVSPLALKQAADGSLSGTVFGQPFTGHYAAGTGTIAFLRQSAPGQPFQLYVGTVTTQGMSGAFYALNAGAGGSSQRMKFDWSTVTTPAMRNLR